MGPQFKGRRVLSCAVYAGRGAAVIEFLVSHGCDPNYRNADGGSAAHVAARQDNLAALKALGAHGALNPKLKDVRFHLFFFSFPPVWDYK